MYGPVRTVVWQGSVGDHRPYADLTRNPESGRTTAKINPSALTAMCLVVRRAASSDLASTFPDKGGPILLRPYFPDVGQYWKKFENNNGELLSADKLT